MTKTLIAAAKDRFVEATNHSGMRTSLEVEVIRISTPHLRDTHADEYDRVEAYPITMREVSWLGLGIGGNIATAHFNFLVRHGIQKDFFWEREYGVARKVARAPKLSRRSFEPEREIFPVLFLP